MSWFRKLGGARETVGIEVFPGGLAVAAKTPSDGPPGIRAMRVLTKEAADTKLAEMLARYVADNSLTGSRCNLVLGHGDYQLLLVEAPDVPDADLRDAIRWRIKDLVSMPLENAVVDVFQLPADGVRGSKRMVYVVVAEINRIKSLIEMVREAELELEAIDIGEMALRNLSLLQDEGADARGVGFARITEGSGTVSLYRGGNLYLSRQFQLNYHGGLLDDLPIDNLILEFQRSLDYYERQMGQAPPGVMYICGTNVSLDKVTPELSRALSVPLKYLEIENYFQFADGTENDLSHVCIGALGGALRNRVGVV